MEDLKVFVITLLSTWQSLRASFRAISRYFKSSTRIRMGLLMRLNFSLGSSSFQIPKLKTRSVFSSTCSISMRCRIFPSWIWNSWSRVCSLPRQRSSTWAKISRMARLLNSSGRTSKKDREYLYLSSWSGAPRLRRSKSISSSFGWMDLIWFRKRHSKTVSS